MTTQKPPPDGSKGCDHRPELCNHPPEDGCMWCCATCNYDRHFCGGCGTIIGHTDNACDACIELYEITR